MNRKDPVEILVNDLKTTLKDSIESLSNSSIQYMRNYGKELGQYLETPAMKKLLVSEAQKLSIDEVSSEIKKRLIKKFPQFQVGKIPIEVIRKDGTKKIYHYDPAKYSYMLARTRTRDLREMALHKDMVESGLDLVVVSIGGSGDACKNWEGKVLSITGKTKGYPTVAEARASGEIWHPHCFIDPQVKIFTSKGRKEIGKIKVGDLVLTHKGRFRRVTHLIRGSTRGPIKKICFDNWRNFPFITLEHPVLTEEGWKEIKDIEVGDKIKVLSHRCPNCGKKIPIWRNYCNLSCAQSYNKKILWEKGICKENKYEFMFIPVIKIEERNTGRKYQTYNLEIEEDESYVCSHGFVAHNCVHSTSPFLLYEENTGEIGVLGRDIEDWKDIDKNLKKQLKSLSKAFTREGSKIASTKIGQKPKNNVYDHKSWWSDDFEEKINSIIEYNGDDPVELFEKQLDKLIKENESIISKKYKNIGGIKQFKKDMLRFKNRFTKSPVIVRFHLEDDKVIKGLIEKGRTINLFEGGPSYGLADKVVRTKWERILSGDASKAKDTVLKINGKVIKHSERPTYGMIGFKEHLEEKVADQYGNSYLVLKDNIKNRCTFTYHDSSLCQTAFTKNNLLKSFAKDASNYSYLHNIVENNYYYLETQIWGGVDLAKDVEKLVINQRLAGTELKNAIKLAKKYKIKIDYGKFSGVNKMKGEIENILKLNSNTIYKNMLDKFYRAENFGGFEEARKLLFNYKKLANQFSLSISELDRWSRILENTEKVLTKQIKPFLENIQKVSGIEFDRYNKQDFMGNFMKKVYLNSRLNKNYTIKELKDIAKETVTELSANGGLGSVNISFKWNKKEVLAVEKKLRALENLGWKPNIDNVRLLADGKYITIDEFKARKLFVVDKNYLKDLKISEISKKKILKREKEIVEKKVEYAFCVDKDGNILMSKTSNQRSYVEFLPDEIEKLYKAEIFTHNHPSSFSFSLDDAVFTYKTKLKEMRAVGKKYTYIMRINPEIDKIVTLEKFQNTWKEIKAEVKYKYDNLFYSGKIGADEANMGLLHDIWKEFSKRFPNWVYYERIKTL